MAKPARTARRPIDRPESTLEPAADTLSLAELREATGFPRGYLNGLIQHRTIDSAISLDGRGGVRIRSIALPLLLLADELAEHRVNKLMDAEIEARLEKEIQAQLETWWPAALAGQETPIHLAQIGDESRLLKLWFLPLAVARWQTIVVKRAAALATK